MKRYIPEKMIRESRFKDFFASLDNSERQQVTDRIERLIAENTEYADSRNYGHLCNLLTSLALVMILEENGKNRREAEKIVADAMYRFIEPQIISMKKLSAHSWFVGFLKVTMPVKFRSTLGYGWDVDFPECPSDTFSMTTRKCIYQQIFTKYGYPEMTVVFCKVDDILYNDLPGAEFTYTEQIGTGGSMCDYSFIKKR